MKKRTDFVSNSSSSSFIIDNNNSFPKLINLFDHCYDDIMVNNGGGYVVSFDVYFKKQPKVTKQFIEGVLSAAFDRRYGNEGMTKQTYERKKSNFIAEHMSEAYQEDESWSIDLSAAEIGSLADTPEFFPRINRIVVSIGSDGQQQECWSTASIFVLLCAIMGIPVQAEDHAATEDDPGFEKSEVIEKLIEIVRDYRYTVDHKFTD